jgi:hypothetical protein
MRVAGWMFHSLKIAPLTRLARLGTTQHDADTRLRTRHLPSSRLARCLRCLTCYLVKIAVSGVVSSSTPSPNRVGLHTPAAVSQKSIGSA